MYQVIPADLPQGSLDGPAAGRSGAGRSGVDYRAVHGGMEGVERTNRRARTMAGFGETPATLARTARRLPFLTCEEERDLALRSAGGDARAAERLLLGHLALVRSLARRYGRLGLPVNDLMQEGVIGLIQAIRRFNPDRDARLATYAMWWVRAAMQDYAVRSWSLVRVGKTASHRALFFHLRGPGREAADAVSPAGSGPGAKHVPDAGLDTGRAVPDRGPARARRRPRRRRRRPRPPNAWPVGSGCRPPRSRPSPSASRAATSACRPPARATRRTSRRPSARTSRTSTGSSTPRWSPATCRASPVPARRRGWRS